MSRTLRIRSLYDLDHADTGLLRVGIPSGHPSRRTQRASPLVYSHREPDATVHAKPFSASMPGPLVCWGLRAFSPSSRVVWQTGELRDSQVGIACQLWYHVDACRCPRPAIEPGHLATCGLGAPSAYCCLASLCDGVTQIA